MKQVDHNASVLGSCLAAHILFHEYCFRIVLIIANFDAFAPRETQDNIQDLAIVACLQ